MTTNVALGEARSDRGAAAPRGGTTSWSWSLGSIAGIDLRVHGTFLVLLAWIALSRVASGQGLAGAVGGVLMTLGMFAIVVLHELAHALVARRFGIGTRNITLLPIGGLATLERMPENPTQELLVAIAGPALNLVLGGLLLGALVALGAPLPSAMPSTQGGSILGTFVWFNFAVAGFNLLPAFPMDGGRVLRALLAMRRGRTEATEIAARVGRWIALVLGIFGLLGNPMLVFIALFVWIGGREEAMDARLASALADVPVSAAMVTSFGVVEANEAVDDVIALHLRTSQRAFPVVDAGRLVGVVGTAELLRAHATLGGRVPVGEVASTSPPVDVRAPVRSALDALARAGASALPVLDRGELVGLLFAENILEIAELRRH